MHRLESYIRLAFIFIIIFTILYLPISHRLKKRGIPIPRQISWLGLFLSLFFIIFATILYTPISFHQNTHTLNLIPFSWLNSMNGLDELLVEKIPNVLLFIPLGFFMPMVFKNMRFFHKTLWISFLITVNVEFIQFFIGRSSDIDDIITNLLGAIIGYGIFHIIQTVFHTSKFWHLSTTKTKL